MFLDTAFDAGKSLRVIHALQSEFIVVAEDCPDPKAFTVDDRFIHLIGNRYMQFIPAKENAGLPMHDQAINLSIVSRIETVSSNTDRYKELRGLVESYKIATSTVATLPKKEIIV